MKHQSKGSTVRACITNVSFPQDLKSLCNRLDAQENQTDLDLLFSSQNQVTGWTAPKWISEGDLLFFYHAVSARHRIRRIREELAQIRKASQAKRIVERVLDRAEIYANTLGGTIFGVGRVTGNAEYADPTEGGAHFRSTIFAPFTDFSRFSVPLPTVQFEQYVKIMRQQTCTPLSREGYEGLKRLLVATTDVPDYFKSATFADLAFRDVDKTNWRDISCRPEARFLYEVQLRDYLYDYFLNETRDYRTPIYRECNCFRGGKSTGFADYFVRLNDNWVPVEAKINLAAEPHLFGQLSKYTEIDYFKPTLGVGRGQEVPVSRSSRCLVVDQCGVYLIRGNKFHRCALDSPLWTRSQLATVSIDTIRAELIRLLAR